MIDGAAVARVLHVLGVVIWIGGVAIITTVILPAAAHMGEAGDGARLFEAVERRFSWIARGSVLVVGASGAYMVWAFDLWSRFGDSAYWWMSMMVGLWGVFAVLLFVIEPLLHRRIAGRMRREPRLAFRRMMLFHWILLIAALVTIAGAVAGAHGWRLFG